jgi:large subunit ribosomal protein L46
MKKYRLVSAIILERSFGEEKKYLLARKPRKSHAWQFPQGGIDPEETFLDAAQRELTEECGKALKIDFVSKNPVGVYQYDFPTDFKRHDPGVIGAKVEFFSAKWILGEVEVDKNEIVEARWLTKEEIKELVDLEYWEVVRDMI